MWCSVVAFSRCGGVDLDELAVLGGGDLGKARLPFDIGRLVGLAHLVEVVCLVVEDEQVGGGDEGVRSAPLAAVVVSSAFFAAVRGVSGKMLFDRCLLLATTLPDRDFEHCRRTRRPPLPTLWAHSSYLSKESES